jgi:predicted phage tail protein
MNKIVEDRNRMIEETNQFINTVKKDNENRHKRVQELIKDNTDKIKELQKFREESEAFEESVVK